MFYTISTKKDIKSFRKCFYSYGDETCKMQIVDIYNQAGKLVGFVLDGDFVSFSESNKTHFEKAKAYAQKRIYKNANTWKKWLTMYVGTH